MLRAWHRSLLADAVPAFSSIGCQRLAGWDATVQAQPVLWQGMQSAHAVSSAPGSMCSWTAQLGGQSCTQLARSPGFSQWQGSLQPPIAQHHRPISSSSPPQLFAAPQPASNLQIHTHKKYNASSIRPVHKWMLGRFLMDREGVVWHKQSNMSSKRYNKSANTLSRLQRWKPLHNTYAAKFRKLAGVPEMLRYWAAPDPNLVPGFAGTAPRAVRLNAKADKRPMSGDHALRPH